ncbi:MAG: dienelactone hydrolase family protein [Sulfolobus sp.]|nr:dienelactone hydrolase family protein [Sulfolobus sp.]
MNSSVKDLLEPIKELLTELIGPFSDDKPPLNVKVLEEKDMDEHVRYKVVYRSEDEDLVPAYLLKPKDKGPFPAIIVHHQHGGRYNIGKNEVVGLADNDVAYGLELVRRGYVILAPDAKCFGERKVKVKGNSSDVFQEKFEAMKLILYGKTLQGKYIWDIMRGIDYLETLDFVTTQKIGMMGFSLGGQQTLYTTALEERIRVGVSISGFSTYRAIIEENLQHNFAFYIPKLMRYKIETWHLLGLIAPKPFMIIAGKKDPIFPIDGVMEAYEKGLLIYKLFNAEDKLTLHVWEGGHESPQHVRELAYNWFDKWLH